MKCFIIALESEAEPLVSRLKEAEAYEAFGRKVYRGILDGEKVAAVISGVGKVNAACAAQYALDILGADCLINFGAAGGLSDRLEIGKLYSVSAAVQYDFDLVQLNGTEIGTLNEYSENYLKLRLTHEYPSVKLATGDRFNDDVRDFKLLTEVLGADVRDMEGGAIAQVCRHAGVPFYSYKVISDVAGKGSTTEQFKNNLEKSFETLSAEMLNILKYSKR